MGQDCKYCGAYISGREDTCPACGKKVRTPESGYAAAAAAAPEYEERRNRNEEKTYTYKDEYQKRYGKNTGEENQYTAQSAYKVESSRREYDDVKMNQAMAYLCYFGPLFLVPYLLRRDSEFIRFHSNQGLMLLLASVAVNVCDFVPIIGGLIRAIGSIFVFVSFIKGLINVSKGLKARLPIIGEIEILK